MTIIERIADELARIFPQTPIYTENQTGGFKEPSFFIEKITTTAASEVFERQMRHYIYQVIYFPNSESPKTDMERVEDILLSNLLELKDYAPLRNKELTQQADNTLIYKFEVWGRFYPENQETMMNNEQVKGSLK